MWDRPRNLFHQYSQSSEANTVKFGEVRLLPWGFSPQDLGSGREGETSMVCLVGTGYKLVRFCLEADVGYPDCQFD